MCIERYILDVCVCVCVCVFCFVLCSTFAVVGCYDVVFKNPKKTKFKVFVNFLCEFFVEFLLLLLLLFFVGVVFW